MLITGATSGIGFHTATGLAPAQFLDYLKAESTHIQNLGRVTVDGVPTTHYRVTIDLGRAGAGMPKSIHATLQKVMRELPGKVLDRTALPVEVWIDDSHLVREMTPSMKLIPDGASRTISTSVKLMVTGYGSAPKPTPPPASQTLNLLPLLKSADKANTSS